MMLTAQQLAAATGCGMATADLWLEPINTTLQRFEINTPKRVAAFLAQIGHESGSLKRVVEGLNYSAEGLRKTWPSRFTVQQSVDCARRPERIANTVYALRMGNGDASSGDGWRYRGRGLIQVTGKTQYTALAQALNQPLLNEPELLEQPLYGALSAGWFWQTNGLNQLADDDRFERITLKINGGFNGTEDRKARLEWAIAALR